MEVFIIVNVLVGLLLLGIALWGIKKEGDHLTIGELFKILFVCFVPGVNIVACLALIDYYKLLDKRIF